LIQVRLEATGRGERGLAVFDAEAGEPIAVFHDQDASGRVGQHTVELAAVAFNPDPTSDHHLRDHQPQRRRALHDTGHVPVSSGLWSAEETRQYATTRPSAIGSGPATSHVPDGVWTTGTGIRPSFAHNQAVW
jgi:hypothetical protein